MALRAVDSGLVVILIFWELWYNDNAPEGGAPGNCRHFRIPVYTIYKGTQIVRILRGSVAHNHVHNATPFGLGLTSRILVAHGRT